MREITLIKSNLTFFLYLIHTLVFFNLSQALYAQEPHDYVIKNCEESDAKATFQIYDLGETILNENIFFDYIPTILIVTISGDIIQFTNLQSGSVSEYTLCGNVNIEGRLEDIAVDSHENVYIQNFDGEIHLIDIADCSVTLLFDDFVTRGLSFDRRDNLYVGNNSIVYRSRSDDLTNFQPWHDFEVGFSSGDFVMFEDKMYIVWNIEDIDHLYEVTVDNTNNYISHINLGVLPTNTLGLASELGYLYGVTPFKIFQINLADFTFSDIVINNSTHFWYGASGFHEAVEIVFTMHESEKDAENDIEIKDDYLFTASRFIYIKYTDVKNNESILIPVSLEVVPKLETIEDIQSCGNYILPSIKNASYFIEVAGEKVSITEGSVIKEDKKVFVVNDICPNDEISFNVTLSTLPKFFTPNNDGSNDEWKVNCDDFIGREIMIQIVDRFGKTVYLSTQLEMGWDGTFNNLKLPESDYWYSIIIDSEKKITGHFSLKR